MRPRHGALIALTLIALVTTAVPVAARTVDPERWARSFCNAITDWGDAVDEIRTDVDAAISDAQENADLRDASNALEDALRKFQRVTRRAGKKIKKAGEPDVPNGAEISERIVEAFDELDRLLADAADEVADLPVDDVEEFQDGAAAIGRDLDRGDEEIGQAFDDVEQLDEDLELAEVLVRVPACDTIAGG